MHDTPRCVFLSPLLSLLLLPSPRVFARRIRQMNDLPRVRSFIHAPLINESSCTFTRAPPANESPVQRQLRSLSAHLDDPRAPPRTSWTSLSRSFPPLHFTFAFHFLFTRPFELFSKKAL